MDKLIYYKKGTDYGSETGVVLIGEHHYVIKQKDLFGKELHLVYLTKKDLKEILKEQEVILPEP